MPNPDVTPYIDLVISDKDPQDIFDAALALLQINLPDWEPREGNTEVLLLEALAFEISELIYAINRVPSAVVEAMLRLYGIERDAGTPPTATLTFNMATTQGHTIPAGTVARLNLVGGLEPVDFTTDIELVIPVGNASGTVAATGDRYTSEANGVVSGTLLDLQDSIIYVDSVALSGAVVAGRDAETDELFFERGIQRFQRLTDTLVLPSHFVAAALEDVNVKRAFALDNYTPANDPDNNGPVGSDPGHVTVAVYGDGANLSGAQKTALETQMEGLSEANLDVHVIDPTINTVAVTVTVNKTSTAEAGDVITNVTTALNDYLSPLTWNWGTTVRRNELISVISNAVGVDYVDVLTAPAADVVLTGVAPLVDNGAITVTVN